jgi:chromosome segregation ATPase
MEKIVKKLEQQEIDQIIDLQKQYNQNIFDLGSIEAQLSILSNQIKSITNEKNNILSDIDKINSKEKELVDTLQEKYGTGNIDLEKGEITNF